jgi:hypothetical protein
MVIANRTLTLRDGGREIEIPIRIHAPAQDGAGWSCRFEIDWPEGTQAMAAAGLDSIQALQLALEMIGANLYTSSYHRSGALVFDAPGDGYGFPVPASLRDLLVGEDAKSF